jgi:2-aminoadipate transaminase
VSPERVERVDPKPTSRTEGPRATRPTMDSRVAHFGATPARSRPSALRELLVSDPEVIPLALGVPAAELFPTAAIHAAAERVLDAGAAALQYGVPCERLKEHVVALMAARGVACRESQVLLVNGAQQANDLLVRHFLPAGGEALVEEASYDCFLTSLRASGGRPVTVPTDDETGMDVERVEAHLRAGPRPAFVYAIPDGQNPRGVSLSREKRARLVELAARFSVPVIEDDVYGYLSYDGPAPPPLRALDGEWVVTIGSFSKLLAPALRVGWVVASEALVARLALQKHALDLDVGTFAQRIVSAYLDTGALPGHLEGLRREYRARREAMRRALREHFPAEARTHVPASGFFFWVELPARVDSCALLRTALERERVAFVPGRLLAAADGARFVSCLRLAFSASAPERIEAGIERLGRLVKEALR